MRRVTAAHRVLISVKKEQSTLTAMDQKKKPPSNPTRRRSSKRSSHATPRLPRHARTRRDVSLGWATHHFYVSIRSHDFERAGCARCENDASCNLVPIASLFIITVQDSTLKVWLPYLYQVSYRTAKQQQRGNTVQISFRLLPLLE